MIGVDTNVLVHASDGSSTHHGACRELLRRSRPWPEQAEALCITWSVIYEFLRVVTHPRVLRQPFATTAAWSFLEKLQQAPYVRVVGPGPDHASHAVGMLSAPGVRGNLVHDAHIAAVLAEHGVRRIYTFDQDYHRFLGLEIVDPLA